MENVGVILAGLVALIICYVIIMAVWEVLQAVYLLIAQAFPFLGGHPIMLAPMSLLLLILLTITVGIVDMVLCRMRSRKDAYLNLRKGNRKLDQGLGELRAKEQKLAQSAEESRQRTAQAYARNREKIERNAVFHQRILRRNHLCTLLSQMGAQGAENLIVRVNGKDIREQEKRLLADYEELRKRFESTPG